MTISSRFYTGFVNNIEWAEGTRRLGFRYAVGGFDDFKVEVDPTGTRRVKILADGAIATGGGIEDTADADELLTLADAPAGTSQWHLVGLRRVWGATNATSVSSITGTSTKQLPTRLATPGVEDFQPLALVQITYGETLPTAVADLRTVADNAGLLVAFDDLVRSYMDAPGTMIRVVPPTGTAAQWVRAYTAGGTPSWERMWLPTVPVGATDYDTGWITLDTLTGWSPVSGIPPQVRRIGHEVMFRGRVRTTSGNDVSGSHTPLYVPGTPTGLKLRPSDTRDSVAVQGPGGAFRIFVGSDGSLNTNNLPGTSEFKLDTVRYFVD